MKKIISMLMVIALLAASAIAFAEGNTQNTPVQGAPQQGQMQGGPMMGGPNQGNRPNGQAPTGQPPFGERPSGAPGMPGSEKPADAPEQPGGEKPADAPELSSGEKPAGAPELPNGEKPVMIDFDAMVAKEVISQETCDRIKAYMEEHKPAEMPEVNGQAPDGEKPADGQNPPELPDGEKAEGMSGMNGQAPETPAKGGLLKELLDAEVITQAEYDALLAVQTASAD
ncbi:MAG: hypothetical protein IKE47_02515 [Oscillospiraceae bacterium]|nr:hypothetical protein [Oscillospiraceae bacterium]